MNAPVPLDQEPVFVLVYLAPMHGPGPAAREELRRRVAAGACSKCYGSGRRNNVNPIDKEPCPACGGSGGIP